MKSRALLLICALSAVVACASTSGDVPSITAPDLGPAPRPCGSLAERYAEPLPRREMPIDDIAFDPDRREAYMRAVLERRYPLGGWVVDVGLARGFLKGSCVTRFLGDAARTEDFMRRIPVIVHECGHYADTMGKEGVAAYSVRPDLELRCTGGASTARGGRTFPRSELLRDGLAAKWPACSPEGRTGTCDMYASLYLGGDPSNGDFELGDLGFDYLLEEALQYVQSLATGLALVVRDSGSAVSHRDGVLVHMGYVARYLRLARVAHPEVYTFLTEDACWRKAILTVWDRSVFYLDATKGEPSLGLDDVELSKLAADPELTKEIDALRSRECR